MSNPKELPTELPTKLIYTGPCAELGLLEKFQRGILDDYYINMIPIKKKHITVEKGTAALIEDAIFAFYPVTFRCTDGIRVSKHDFLAGDFKHDSPIANIVHKVHLWPMY